MEIIKEFLKKGYLISPKVLNKLKKEDINKLIEKLSEKDLVITEDLYSVLTKEFNIKILKEYKKSKTVKKNR